jgi:hypothetical protein
VQIYINYSIPQALFEKKSGLYFPKGHLLLYLSPLDQRPTATNNDPIRHPGNNSD